LPDGGVVPDGGPKPDGGSDGGPVIWDGGSDGGPVIWDGGSDGGPVIWDGGSDGGPKPDGGTDGGPVIWDGGVGAPCSQKNDCFEGTRPKCFSEADTSGVFPGGYCSADCDALLQCPAGAVCGNVFSSTGACIQACDPATTGACRPGYACSDALGPMGCIPQILVP